MKVLIVFALLSVLWSPSISQHFCDSYLKNGHKLYFFNDLDGNYPKGCLIIENKYWRMTKSTQGIYAVEADQPLGSDDRLTKYSFPIRWQFVANGVGQWLYGFYNPKNKTVDQFSFDGVLFNLVKENVGIDRIDLIEDVTRTAFDGSMDVLLTIYEKFDISSQRPRYEYIRLNARSSDSSLINLKRKISEDYDYSDGYHVIGGSSFRHFLSNNSTIVYCYYFECEKVGKRKVFVDCQQWLVQQNSTTTSKVTSRTPPTPTSTVETIQTTIRIATTNTQIVSEESKTTFSSQVLSESTESEPTIPLITTSLKTTLYANNANEAPKTTSKRASNSTTNLNTVWNNPLVRISLIIVGIFIVVYTVLICGSFIAFWIRVRDQQNDD